MNWDEYKVNAERTLSTQFHCDTKDELLLHAIIGVLTEMDELLENHTDIEADEINREEELFDAVWYLSIIGREYNLDIPKIATTSIVDPFEIVLNIIKKSLKILDFLKKKLYYNKDINQELLLQYSKEIISLVVSYANIYNINIESGFDTNINKLKARYPEKFSSDRAINRDLTTEREILEGKVIA